jgi:hypothetical protein
MRYFKFRSYLLLSALTFPGIPILFSSCNVNTQAQAYSFRDSIIDICDTDYKICVLFFKEAAAGMNQIHADYNWSLDFEKLDSKYKAAIQSKEKSINKLKKIKEFDPEINMKFKTLNYFLLEKQFFEKLNHFFETAKSTRDRDILDPMLEELQQLKGPVQKAQGEMKEPTNQFNEKHFQ